MGDVLSNSDFLTGRNYTIQKREISPELSWQPNVYFRISGQYSYRQKDRIDLESDEYSIINEGTASIVYSKADNLSLNAIFKLSNIEFQGIENSATGYVLLEALRPGQNMLWSIVLQKKILKGLQMAINYEGRSSESAETVHIGRMQVSALF